MRYKVAIVIAAIVAASCIPVLRESHAFAITVGVTAVALLVLMIVVGWGWISRDNVLWKRTLVQWTSNKRIHFVVWSVVALLIFTVPHYVATSCGAYEIGVSTAHDSPQFVEVLGGPVKEAWFSEGKIEFGDPRTAHFLIPVRGKLRSATLRVRATERNGTWELNELVLETASPDKQVDLLSGGKPDRR